MSHDTGPAPHRAATSEVSLTTSDGVTLRAEVAVPVHAVGPGDGTPAPVDAAVVVCHPHPLYGGSMHANVVDALFRSLPPRGAAVLRFNFRGAGGSGGTHDEGRAERLDALAAVEEAVRRWPDRPIVLAGYSFGADVALAVDHEALAGWLGIAPVLRIVDQADMVALRDPRPTWLLAAVHDQYRPHDQLVPLVDGATATTVARIDGADHFFMVGLDQVAAAALGVLAAVTAPAA